MRVLGIDSSLTATGLARIDIGDYDDNLQVWSHDVSTVTVGAPKPTKDKSKRALARRVNALIEQIEWCFKDDDPDAVALEGLAYGARGEAAWILPWVFGRIIELCETYDVPLQIVATSARAKFAAGKGNADKDHVLAAAIKLFPGAEIASNNEADAAIVGAVLCQKLEKPITDVTQYRIDVVNALGE
jgi:Holliday junction resolvasome RuvABC endonuclease subunit